MSAIHLFMFDDAVARQWAPFTLTRPVGELLFGCMRLRDRAAAVFGQEVAGYVSRSALLGFDEPGAGNTLSLVEIPDEGTRILISSRAVLDFQDLPAMDEAARILVDGTPAGWVVPEGHALPAELYVRDPAADPREAGEVSLRGRVLERPWHLMAANARQVAADVHRLGSGGDVPDGVHVVGDAPVSLAEGAVLEPGVVVDTRDGPVRVEAGAYVAAPARLVGPLFVGPGSTVLGGDVGSSSIGPHCKVRGEISDCVLMGYTNKAHDGHLGHAMLGRWVNLGAGTTNSDLKNNYGNVRVWTLDGIVDTGLMKMGCLMGDHVKTGIGTLISTGTVVGAGSNLFGGAMAPTVVPPFSWGTGVDLRDYRLDKFLRTAEVAMGRRNQPLTPGVRRILEDAWSDTAGRRAE
jgi:UDP-N-acetylglucosamine diphosphorylase/glucosamine-1-phosphate N-acetyltransferase